MIMVVSVLLIFIVILTILDIKEYLKNKNENESLNIEEETINPKEDKIEAVLVEDEKEKEDIPFFEEIPDNNQMDEITLEDDGEVLISDFKEESNDILEELNKVENTMVTTNQDLENTINSFEMEQERTAIISLDELMQKSDELYNENEFVQYDDGNEPITIDEVINMYNKEKEQEEKSVPNVMADIVEEKIEPYSRKESVPFISSVYGIEKNNNLEFENTATYEKLSRVQNREFMNKLREIKEEK